MISIAGLGVYIKLVHGSSKYICSECIAKTCPICYEKLESKNHCTKCKVAICPFCGSVQPAKRPRSILFSVVGLLFFIVGLVIIIVLMFIDFMWMVLFVLVILCFSSPVCKKCGKRIHTQVF